MGVGWKRVWLASPSGWHRTDDQELPGKAEDSMTIVNAHVGPTGCQAVCCEPCVCCLIHSSQQPCKLSTALYLFCRGRNWSSERSSDLPKVTQYMVEPGIGCRSDRGPCMAQTHLASLSGKLDLTPQTTELGIWVSVQGVERGENEV